MEKITSAQNPLVKKLVHLSEKSSARKKEQLIILDGIHLAQEFLKKIGAPEICVVMSGDKNQEILKIIEECQRSDVRIIELSKNLFAKISPVVHGAGLIFVSKTPESSVVNFGKNTVILEEIQDPGNLGTILRSAAAFGFEQIICSKKTVSVWSPKVLRAAMGAHFNLEIVENADIENIIPQFKIPVFATSLNAKKTIFEADLSGKKVWIFGNEGSGVSLKIQNLASEKVIIPQTENIESLNVAMAASVCFFESYRQENFG